MNVRTDLAIEQICEINQENGIKKTDKTTNGILTVEIEILNKKASQQIKKPMGRYLTIHLNSMQNSLANFENIIKTFATNLKSLLDENIKSALIVGLGNDSITPDALGTMTIKNIFATRHIKKSIQDEIGLVGIFPVCAIAPGVLGQTGIESAEIVNSLVKTCKPDVVIVVDALAAKEIARLGNTIQLSNIGISPGSGVLNARAMINEETLGVPVISVGVPMVVDMATIAQDLFSCTLKESEKYQSIMVTPREIDVMIEHCSKLIGYGINLALQPNLSLDEIIALVS
ncbi:MAG: GPR endopeptidase [Oscillospiraceae bacterium]